MRGVLIQHGSGECAVLLAAAERWHRAYCAQHDYELLCNYNLEVPNRHPVWNKIALLLGTMNAWPSVPFMFLLDADALIKHKEVALEKALGAEYEVALVVGEGYANSGFIAMRNSEKVRDWFQALYLAGPLKECNQCVDGRLFEMIKDEKCPVKVQSLGSEWNYFDKYGNGPRPVSCERNEAHIVAWHGQTRDVALKAMMNELGELH